MNLDPKNFWQHPWSTVYGFGVGAFAVLVKCTIYYESHLTETPILLFVGLAAIVVGSLYGNEKKTS